MAILTPSASPNPTRANTSRLVSKEGAQETDGIDGAGRLAQEIEEVLEGVEDLPEEDSEK